MKMSRIFGAVAGAAMLSLSGVQTAGAGVVTFDDLTPDIYFGDTDFSSGGFAFTATSFLTPPGGLVGSVDTAAGFMFGNAPTNAVDQFYAGLNDGALRMTTGNDRALLLSGFDFSFIPAVPGFYVDYSPGALVVQFETWSGEIKLKFFEFPKGDPDGLFAFQSIGAADLGELGQALRSATFFACIYANEGCINPAGNEAQFALDNIYASVPEPGSLALLVLGLGLMAGAARRRTVRQ